MNTPLDPRIELLTATVQKLSRAHSYSAVQDIVKYVARRLVDADGATFVLRDGGFCHYLDEDAVAPLWKGRRFPLDECVSGWVMQHAESIVIPDIYSDERVPSAVYRPTFVKSLAMAPIGTSEAIGAIGVYWAEQRELAAHELGLLEALANSTAVALENIRLVDALNRLAGPQAVGPVEKTPSPSHDRVVRLCSWTGRVHHDGRWVSIEGYLGERFGVQISHGISEDGVAMIREMLDQG